MLVVALALLLHGVAGVSANAAAPAVAAEPEWKQTNGPGGGSVDALIIDPLHPGTLYRGSNATIGMGVYKTLPGGRLWRPASVGIPSPEVVALAIDPLDPTTLYAGTLETGVFKSSDGALTWMAANDGLPIDGTAMLRRLVIDPSTPSTIYVGLGDQFGPDGGVFKSTDGGDTWARSSLGLPVITKFEALAMAPSDPSVLYASFESAFDLLVYKTVDSGASWTPANNGLLTNASVEDLAIDPTDPLTLYAGTVDAGQGPNGGVYRTVDGGGSWVQMNTGLPDEPGVQAVAVDPTAPDTIYAGMWALNLGVYKSTDGAATWHLIETGSLALTIVIDSSHPNTVYVGTEHSGLAKSSDGGGTWQLVNSGIPERDTGEVIVDPSGGGTVYAAGCSVAKSTDGGRIWEEWIDNGIEGCVVALAVDTSSRSVLYAGSEDGVLRSANGGRRWIRTNILTSPILDVAVDPLAPGTVYAGTSGAGIYKSTNFGRTWAQVNSGLTNLVVEVLATDPSSAGTVYAGTFGGGVFKTTDGGTLWAGMNNGMTKPYVKALAIDPSAPLNVLLASHNAGCHGTSLFKSTDGGASWTTTFTLGCGLGAIGFDALAVDPSEPATVYAGHRDEGVYRSTDGGQSWVEFRQGLATTHVNSLASDGSVIYAGSMPTGVYKLVTG